MAFKTISELNSAKAKRRAFSHVRQAHPTVPRFQLGRVAESRESSSEAVKLNEAPRRRQAY